MDPTTDDVDRTPIVVIQARRLRDQSRQLHADATAHRARATELIDWLESFPALAKDRTAFRRHRPSS